MGFHRCEEDLSTSHKLPVEASATSEYVPSSDEDFSEDLSAAHELAGEASATSEYEYGPSSDEGFSNSERHFLPLLWPAESGDAAITN